MACSRSACIAGLAVRHLAREPEEGATSASSTACGRCSSASAGLVYAWHGAARRRAAWIAHGAARRSGPRDSAFTSPCAITASPRTGATRRSARTTSRTSSSRVSTSCSCLQAALAWIVALPFMAIAQARPDSACSTLLGIALLAAFGIVFEAVADWQLERFKARRMHRRRVLDTRPVALLAPS